MFRSTVLVWELTDYRALESYYFLERLLLDAWVLVGADQAVFIAHR